MCFARPRQRSIGSLQHNNGDDNNSEYNRSYNIIIIICTDRVLNEGPSKKRNTFLPTSRQIFIIIAYIIPTHSVYTRIPHYTFSILFNTNSSTQRCIVGVHDIGLPQRCLSILKNYQKYILY